MQSFKFPSGLSISRAKDRAKKSHKNGEYEALNQALDAIAMNETSLPWALAVASLENAKAIFSDDANLISAKNIEEIMLRYPDLAYEGFILPTNQSEYFYERYVQITKSEYLETVLQDKQSLLNANEQCQRACLYLQHLDKRKTINYSMGSYGLKHNVEFFSRATNSQADKYISNGAFICAAIHMGFQVKRNNEISPNACINASSKSDIFKWRELYERKDNYPYPKEIEELAKLNQRFNIAN